MLVTPVLSSTFGKRKSPEPLENPDATKRARKTGDDRIKEIEATIASLKKQAEGSKGRIFEMEDEEDS